MIIHPDSHLDHALTPDQIAFVLSRCLGRTGFFIETLELPDDLGTVPCGLHGPVMGDEPVRKGCRWQNRGERKFPSRLCNLPPRPTRTVTVIAGPHEDCECILYTAFGGPLAPKEIGDPSLVVGTEDYSKSLVFWTEHALSGE